jgi:UDP-glucose 4-epimerase
MKAAITGGAGYIGSRLGRRLAHAGWEVNAIDNLHRGKPEAVAEGVRLVEGDVRDEQTLLEATRGADLVYHLAAESAVMSAAADPEYCFSTNVTGTFRVMRAAQANGVKRVVFSSSREVYGEGIALPVREDAPQEPRNIYGASKAAGEKICGGFANDMEISIVRLANVYGPSDKGRVIPKFVHAALRDIPLTLFGTAQLMDFVWVDTVVDTLVGLGTGASYLPGPFNIGSGKGTTIVDLAHRVVEAAGSKSAVEVAARREVEVMRFVADTRVAERDLGLRIPDDPLFGLPAVIEAARNEIT